MRSLTECAARGHDPEGEINRTAQRLGPDALQRKAASKVDIAQVKLCKQVSIGRGNVRVFLTHGLHRKGPALFGAVERTSDHGKGEPDLNPQRAIGICQRHDIRSVFVWQRTTTD